MADKKIPLRTCVVCRNSFEKRDLIRVVHNKADETFCDPAGKAQGRGAYICKSEECLKKAIKTKVFNKVFKAEIPASLYEEITKLSHGS